MKNYVNTLALCLIVIFFVGCNSVNLGDKETPHIKSEGSLSRYFPVDRGWDFDKLGLAREYGNTVGSAAVIVLDKGKLVAEWGDTSTKYNSHSMRKSLLSLLYGIGRDKGIIDFEQSLGELNIDDKEPKLTEQEKEAKIIHLLKARSGVYHGAAYETSDMKKLRPELNSHAPGSFWYYNNWDFNALGTIFEKKTDMTIGEGFQSWIADEIGMEDFQKEDVSYVFEEVSEHPAYPFYISARDLARVGQLVVQEGSWAGERVVSHNYIQESTRSWSKTNKDDDYGYLWWIKNENEFYAWGFGGHYIYIDKLNDIVIVHRVDTGLNQKELVLWYLFGKKVDYEEFCQLKDLILDARS